MSKCEVFYWWMEAYSKSPSKTSRHYSLSNNKGIFIPKCNYRSTKWIHLGQYKCNDSPISALCSTITTTCTVNSTITLYKFLIHSAGPEMLIYNDFVTGEVVLNWCTCRADDASDSSNLYKIYKTDLIIIPANLTI